jgi:hypothetical protein
MIDVKTVGSSCSSSARQLVRLSGADIARQDDEAILAADCLLQERQRFSMAIRCDKKARIRRQREGWLYETRNTVRTWMRRGLCAAWELTRTEI